MSEQCYVCESVATGREHIPPRCVFPKGHRRELITVPSCDTHNLQKSKDDEYLRTILASAPGNNELCLPLVTDSMLRGLDRRPHLVDEFFPNLRPIDIGGVETGMFKVDLERFTRCVTSVVQGLYFHHRHQRLSTKVIVVWGPLFFMDSGIAPFFKVIQKADERLGPVNRGANRKVFCYSFDSLSDRSSRLCRLRFFEGHPIYAVWKAEEI